MAWGKKLLHSLADLVRMLLCTVLKYVSRNGFWLECTMNDFVTKFVWCDINALVDVAHHSLGVPLKVSMEVVDWCLSEDAP